MFVLWFSGESKRIGLYLVESLDVLCEVEDLRNGFEVVGRLLVLLDLTNDARNSSSLGVIDKSIPNEVRVAILDEGEIREIHSQVGNQGWIFGLDDGPNVGVVGLP